MLTSHQTVLRHRQGGIWGQFVVAPLFTLAMRFKLLSPLQDSPDQKAVDPVFFEPAPGDSGYYEIPAYLRKRIIRMDLDNHSRLAAYSDRVRALIEEQA